MRQRRLWFDLHDEACSDPDVVVVGLPYDGATSRRAGAAVGPAKLREISLTADPITRRGRRLTGLTLRDDGDILPVADGGGALTQRAYLDEAVRRMAAIPARSFVIALGGDNSVSIASLQAFTSRHGKDAGVIWFDAHPDLFESYDGNPDSHACALRRGASLAGVSEDRCVLLATRSFSDGEIRYIRERGLEMVTAAEWLEASPEAVAQRIAARLEGCGAVYLAVDIDGFDASCAPGTGYPMPGGVGSEPFFLLMEALFERLPVRGMDLTEIAPPLDPHDITSFLGVQVILEALGALLTARQCG